MANEYLSEIWRINIENLVSEVSAKYGKQAVSSLFNRYDATCLEDLSPSFYRNVFNNFELMVCDD